MLHGMFLTVIFVCFVFVAVLGFNLEEWLGSRIKSRTNESESVSDPHGAPAWLDLSDFQTFQTGQVVIRFAWRQRNQTKLF